MGRTLVLLVHVPKDSHVRGRATSFSLASPSLSGGRSLLHAGGLLLGVSDPIATVTVLSGQFCWARLPHPLPVQTLRVVRQRQEGVWGLVLPQGT